MLTATGFKSSKKEPRETLGSASPKTKAADSVKVNPLWQSLALRACALQPKLIIGHADNHHEREADRVAEQVMRAPALASSGHGLAITPVTAHQAQRICAECEAEEEDGALQ